MAKLSKEEQEELMEKRNNFTFGKQQTKTPALSSLLNIATPEEEQALSDGIIDETKYYCNHRLQRKTGQWSKTDKSLLIDSIIKGYPIGYFTIVTEEEEDNKGKNRTVHYILDGIQRISTIKEFMDGEFKIANVPSIAEELVGYSIPSKEIEGDEFTYKLKDVINNYITAANDCSQYSQEEIRQLFLRANGGKPLNVSQKEATNLDSVVRDKINALRNITIPVEVRHTRKENETKEVLFWDKTAITALNCVRDIDRDILMQTLYLMTLKPNDKPEAFTTKTLYDNFGKTLSDMPANELDSLLARLEKAIKELGKYLPSVPVEGYTKLKKTAIPYVLYAMDKVIRNKKGTKAFAYAIYDFCMNYKNNTEFREIIKSGTNKSEPIQKRLEYFTRMANNAKVTDEEYKALADTLYKTVTDPEPKEKKVKDKKTVENTAEQADAVETAENTAETAENTAEQAQTVENKQ